MKRRLMVVLILLAMLCGITSGCRREFLNRNRVPAPIADLEEGAEDVFDLAVAGRWNRAASRTTVLRESTARFEADEGRQFPQLERAISELDRAVASKDPRRAGHSANEVIRETVSLASHYLEKDRASILLLDVESREVLVQADDDPVAADAAVARLNDLWRELRPEIEKRGGHDLLTRCDAHLAKLASDRPSIRKVEARALLETIDQLEDLYTEGQTTFGQ